MNASGEMAGAPDLLAIYKGYAVGIEVKKPGGRATELQKRILKNFKYGGVFDNVEDVKMLLMEITLNG